MPEEILDVVNEQDEVIGQVSRATAYDHPRIIRIAHVFVENERGEMLLQKRSRTVSYKPGAWVTAAAGHIRAGETYEQAGHREMLEEIGVDAPLEMAWKEYFANEDGQYFLGSLKAKHDDPFAHDPNDVELVQFASLPEIQAMIDRGDDFHPQFLFLLVQHFGLRPKK